MSRPVTDAPAASTIRCRRFRKRKAMIDTFTTLAYSTNDNASLEALQSFLDSINKDTQEETVEPQQ